MSGAILTAIACAICGAIVYTIGAVAGFRRGRIDVLNDIYAQQESTDAGRRN